MKEYHLKNAEFFWEGFGLTKERTTEMENKMNALVDMVGSDEIPNSRVLFNRFMDIATNQREAIVVAFEAGRQMQRLDALLDTIASVKSN